MTVAAAFLLERFARPLALAATATIDREQSSWLGVDFASRHEVRLLQDLVRIDTSQPNPDEVAAAEYIAARLAVVGVQATIERFADRRANVWAILEGDDPRALVLHGHLDVEPLLDAGDWRHPPLSATIDGPWIFGRGMYDMKSLLAAQLLAFEAVARSGRRPARSLMLLATSSEEVGSDLGTRWILAEHPELVARMGTVLTEGGVVEAVSPTDIKYWGIEFAQKHYARFEICSSRRDDVEAFREYLLELPAPDPTPAVEPAVQTFLASYGPTRSLALYRELLAEPDRLPLEADRFAQLTPFLRTLFRNEIVPFRPEPGEDGGWRLQVAVHLLPGAELEPQLDRLRAVGALDLLTRTPVELRGARGGSAVDHPDFRTVVSAIERHHPGAAVGPYFLPVAATDARYFREHGLPAYGVSPFAVMASETTGVGTSDERMQLPAYLVGVALYEELVRELVD